MAVFSMIACSNNNQRESSAVTTEMVTVTHSLGETEVPLKPGRVISLDYGALEILDGIGANVVGIPKTGLPQYLNKYEDEAVAENLGTMMEFNLEKINELEPDLIVLGPRQADSYDAIARIAPVILQESSTDGPVEALERNLSVYGKVFELEEELHQEMEQISEKVAQVQEKVARSDKNALVILHNRGRFSAFGKGSRFGLIFDTLGVEEASEGLDNHHHGTRISSEYIQQINPDILFIIDRSAAIGDQPLNRRDVENELIQQTNAYKEGHIHYLDSQAWYLSAGGGTVSLNIMLDEIDSAF